MDYIFFIIGDIFCIIFDYCKLEILYTYMKPILKILRKIENSRRFEWMVQWCDILLDFTIEKLIQYYCTLFNIVRLAFFLELATLGAIFIALQYFLYIFIVEFKETELTESLQNPFIITRFWPRT